MYALSPEQMKIHERAMAQASQYLAVENNLVETLQEVDRLKLFKVLDKRSLFAYANETLGLEKNVAYALITVARKAMDVPELKSAIREKRFN